MDLEGLFKNINFVEFVNYVENIKLDIFNKEINGFIEKKVRGEHGTVFDGKKIRSKNYIQQYQANFLNYKSALNKIKDLYTDFKTHYDTELEFIEDLFLILKNNISQHIAKSNNSLPSAKHLDNEFYDKKRKEYLSLMILPFIHSKKLHLRILYNKLKDSSIDEIKLFIDYIENKAQTLEASGYRRDTSLMYLLGIDLDKSMTRDNTHLISQKILINKHNFNSNNPKLKNDSKLLKVLTFLLNYIELYKTGMIDKGIGFDGFRFFDKNGKNVNIDYEKMIKTKLIYADREKQSNFVLNEDFAIAIKNIYKKPIKINGNKEQLIYNIIEDGDTIKVTKTMFKLHFLWHDAYNEKNDDGLYPGYCVKVKRENLNNGNFDFAIYYFCDSEMKHGIQLARMDKISDLYLGNPSSHILRGGEKIYSTFHMHIYNILDAVVKNYKKQISLGAMDIAYNFLNLTNIDICFAEELFNNACGIDDKNLTAFNNNRKYNEPLNESKTTIVP